GGRIGRAEKGLGLYGFARQRMGDRTARCREHQLFSAGDRRRQAGPLVSDASEVGGEPVKVVLSPDFKRMVVALGALETNAQKKLADRGHHLGRLAAVAKERHGPVAPGAATGRDQFSHKLVVRQIAPKGVSQPRVETERGLDADAV